MKTEPLDISRVADESTRQQTPPPNTLDAIVQFVRRDAVTNSQQYLDETTVPHGGE